MKYLLLVLLVSCGEKINTPGSSNEASREPNSHITEICYDETVYLLTSNGGITPKIAYWNNRVMQCP